MARDSMQAMPMSSPRQEFGSAAVQWACTRRGRMMGLMVVLVLVFVGLMELDNHQTLSSRYHDISAYYQWRPYLANLPSIIHTPFKTPSNTTLQLENGEIEHVPANLKKSTPNFHLVMPAQRDTEGFCKTTMSAMLLSYPPPTTVQLYGEQESDVQRERDTLNGTLHYLNNEKLVKDQDLVLIVDGEQSWFQLPSDVIVAQYKRLLADANIRLRKRYGMNKDGLQKFNQTVVFGAEKVCENDDMACKYVPPSVLPDNLYVEERGRRLMDEPAKFLHAKMIMGPANDLRTLYRAALDKFEDESSQSQTVQSVFTALFGEQQLYRDTIEIEQKPTSAKFKAMLVGRDTRLEAERRLARANVQLRNDTQHEFSMGLDYTHTLFQPLSYSTEDELVPLPHDNSTDLSQYRHPKSQTKYLSLPPILSETKPPFWRPDFVKHNPSPNEKPAYIDKLEFTLNLDTLPDRNVPWGNISLIQNTYTGAIPAILLNDSPPLRASYPSLTWNTLWYSDYKRALLRNYFRTPQSPNGYHDSLVGGDRSWDQRGGRGGVWTEAEQIWLPWGEVDGVCGSLWQLQAVFHDGLGVWLHELEVDGENSRVREELEYRIKLQEQARKEEERRRKMEAEMEGLELREG